MPLPTSLMAKLDRRAWTLLAAGAVVVLTGATAGVTHAYQEGAATTASLDLRDGQREVGLERNLVLTLSRPVTLDQVRAAFRLDPAVEGEMTGPHVGSRFIFRGSAPYADLTRYTARLLGGEAGGHRLQPAAWHFTTTIVPRVAALTTEGGASLGEGAEVPLGISLQLVFNTTMDAARTRLLVAGTPVELSWSPDSRSATIAGGLLRAGPLELSLAEGADQAGRAAAPWTLRATAVYRAQAHTVPLRFPALVQIPNDPSARDQSGLQSADLVFEYATEAAITRMTAIFTRAPDVIGPTRSGRLISFKLARHYRGMLFLSGLSQGSFARLNADPVPTLFDSQGYFHRSGARPPPNNLYIDGGSVARAEEAASVPAYQLRPGVVDLKGEEATTVSVPEHASTYSYDARTGTYTKAEDGHQMADASLGQPLRIRLLVVLHTTVTTTGIVEDANGVRGLDYDLEGGGRAELYFEGQRVAGSWASPDRASPLQLKRADGSLVAMPGGLVWIDVVR